jgi:hypothetical protein
VQGDDIVVTLPGTSYVLQGSRLPSTKSHSGREDQDAPMTLSEFPPTGITAPAQEKPTAALEGEKESTTSPNPSMTKPLSTTPEVVTKP